MKNLKETYWDFFRTEPMQGSAPTASNFIDWAPLEKQN